MHRAFSPVKVSVWPFANNAIVSAVVTTTLGYGNLWFK